MPKCLLPVGEKPLLAHTLDHLFDAGVTEVRIVTGYCAGQIRDFVRTTFPRMPIRFFHNAYFAKTNNAYSLLLAKPALQGAAGEVSRGVLLLDSDIFFPKSLLPALFSVPGENRVAVRVAGRHDLEEIRVEVGRMNRIIRIGKETPILKTYGESIGIELFSAAAASRLFAVLQQRVRFGAGRTEYYEAAFQQMVDEGVELTAVDVGSHEAIEIDTPDDLAAARALCRT